MASLLPEGKQKYFNNEGVPMVGGKVYTYDAGTTTPRATFSDAAGLVANPWPVILDARGEATIFWSGAYKVTLTDSMDVPIWTVDNIQEITSEYRTSATGSVIVPVGTTAQRDAPPATGYFRFNLTLNQFEGYDGADWKTFISSSEVQQNTYAFAVATGTGDAIIGEFVPDITSVSDGMLLRIRAPGTNTTTTPTFTPNNGTIGAKIIITNDPNSSALKAGMIVSGAELLLMFDLASDRWILINPFIFPGITQRIISADYGLVYADIGIQLYHDNATPHIVTIPSNASTPFPIGSIVTIINSTGGGALSIAISTDTLVWAGVGSTGTRILAADGMATIMKITATKWIISGVGLT